MKMLLLCYLALAVLLVHQSVAVKPPYGQLSIEGTHLVGNDTKQPVQLIGMSLFWSQHEVGSKFWNKETVDALKCSWNANVVRAAMGVEDGGYLTKDKKDTEFKKVTTVVDAAIAAGMYVIVDWHDHNADQHVDQAIDFFKQIATKYGNETNILYETWNEPLKDVDWSSKVKPYHEKVIAAIRAIDSKNIIIVGTPSWDQEVDKAAKDPIKGQKNIAYALHYYAASHKEDLRVKAKGVIADKENGLPLFVTEYGTVEASGGGGVNADESKKWWDFLDENKISYVNWAIEDKPEGAAALTAGTTSAQVGDDSKLTESGKLVKEHIKKKDTGVKCNK